MKLVSYQNGDGAIQPGILQGEEIIDLLATDRTLAPSLREILTADQLPRLAQISENPQAVRIPRPTLVAPIPDPGKVVCIGLNYRDHAEETGAAIPTNPIVFNKFSTAVIGPEQSIQLPASSQQVDYEAELVVVIGRKATDVPAAQAMEYVAGYMNGHDVSARDWQLQRNGQQWLLGKTFDTFAPTGPALVTADEVPDPHKLRIQFRLNGETVQDSNTRQLIFQIPQLIAHVSAIATLLPGDLIFTGTPHGVGFVRKPQVFLQPGCTCEVEVEGLGVLRNGCVARS